MRVIHAALDTFTAIGDDSLDALDAWHSSVFQRMEL